MLTYILSILGFIFLIKGAGLLVDGASSLAKKFKISNIAIGLTVVAFGTSMPELFINIVSNFKGAADLAVGNIIGASIANILLITGIAAALYPIGVKKSTAWRQIPLALFVIVALFFLGNDFFSGGINILGRTDGIILLLIFAVFLYYTFGISRVNGEEHVGYKKQKILKSIGYIILGAAGLAIGSQWVVNGSVAIAQTIGLSEAIIGLTIVSIGTTLPELTASIVAVVKKSGDIAIGNIIGSTIFNIAFILGLSSLIKPINFNVALNTDIFIALGAVAFLYYFIFVGKRRRCIERYEGIGLFAAYLVYIVFLVMRG